MTISKPIIKEIQDNENALSELEKEIYSNKSESIQKIIGSFPTVYIHNWSKYNKYEVYVGETNNIFNRTREHFYAGTKNKDWHGSLKKRDASLYIIGHEHFNKSLTLDIENRLMHYLMSVDNVRQVHNGRGNPQGNYYPSNEFDVIFSEVWRELHRRNDKLFPNESAIKDSAIYKASPLHKLTRKQEDAKNRIISCVENAMNQKEKQIIFIDGEAGTGKTVLNSSAFYELLCRTEKQDAKDFKCYMIVNHKEQVKVYADIFKKLGIEEKYGKVVSKASPFLNQHKEDDSIDVAFIDEAHLLFTQGNQGYRGKNQLDDIVKKAKITVIVFDENQILRMDQYWESQMIEKYRNKAIAQNNHIILTEQLRMHADKDTLHWIDSFTKEQRIEKIPHGDYEIKIFDSPMELETAITEKAQKEESKLSRLIASYDWQYKEKQRPQRRALKYWEVMIKKWHRPWNYELSSELTSGQRRAIANQAWAEQEHTIREVGSTYTIQGFDLNYAGIILGKSVRYRNGKIEYDPSRSSNDKVHKCRKMNDGTMKNFGEELIKHEVRVLMTRGVNGMYIYACDDELRNALKKAES